MDMLAFMKSNRLDSEPVFYELARLSLSFKNNQKMQTNAVMVLNSMMESKDQANNKNSVNLRAVSLELLRRCSFNSADTAKLLEPHTTQLFNIIETENDLSLRLRAMEVLPQITSSQNYPTVLSQMKDLLLSLTDNADDRVISRTLSSNLFDLVSKQSGSPEDRITESVELLLLCRDPLEPTKLYRLMNVICASKNLQPTALNVVLQAIPRGKSMTDYLMLTWYVLGSFGSSIFRTPSPHFQNVLSLLTLPKDCSTELELLIISAISKLLAGIERDSHHNDPDLTSDFKTKALQVLRNFLTHSNLETQSRASQFLFIIQNKQLNGEEKATVFEQFGYKFPSVDFDQDSTRRGSEEQIEMLFDIPTAVKNEDQDLLGIDFADPVTNTKNFEKKNPSSIDFLESATSVGVPPSQARNNNNNQQRNPISTSNADFDLFMSSPSSKPLKLVPKKRVSVPQSNLESSDAKDNDPFNFDAFESLNTLGSKTAGGKSSQNPTTNNLLNTIQAPNDGLLNLVSTKPGKVENPVSASRNNGLGNGLLGLGLGVMAESSNGKLGNQPATGGFGDMDLLSGGLDFNPQKKVPEKKKTEKNSGLQFDPGFL